MILIESGRLTLKPLSLDELKALWKGDLDGFRRGPGWPSKELLEGLPHFINDMQDDPSCYGWNIWTISHDDRIIGDCGFKSKPDEKGSVEIGFSVIPAERSNGFAQEALGGLIRWGFENSATNVIAEVERDNIPSVNLLLKMGFERFDKIGKMAYFRLFSI